MALYRIHRLKEGPREIFRWAPHTGGLAIVKPKDYEAVDELEAGNAYSAWQSLKEKGQPLHPGDLLETLPPEGQFAEAIPDLKIAKYVGFEPAQWFVPEPKGSVSTPETSQLSSPNLETYLA